VVARGATPAAARALAYEGTARVHFEGMQFRRDIGEAGSEPGAMPLAAPGPAAGSLPPLPIADPTGGGPIS
jgi:hypothetical protein